MNKKKKSSNAGRGSHFLAGHEGPKPGAVTLIHQCVCMIVPNFTKKGCILKVCTRTQMYTIFSKRVLFVDDVLTTWKKGYIFVILKNVKS